MQKGKNVLSTRIIETCSCLILDYFQVSFLFAIQLFNNLIIIIYKVLECLIVYDSYWKIIEKYDKINENIVIFFNTLFTIIVKGINYQYMHLKEQLFEILLNDYLKYFYNFSLSRTASITDAEDLSQRILVECVDAINREVDIQNINTYFWSIAHNTYKRYLKEINNNIVYDNEYCMRIEDSSNVDTSKENEYAKIRYCLLVLSGMYRKIQEYYLVEQEHLYLEKKTMDQSMVQVKHQQQLMVINYGPEIAWLWQCLGKIKRY